MVRWYLLQTKPSSEARAKLHLERQQYEVHFARLKQPVRVAGRWTERVTPLFPRYLFVRLEEGRQAFGPLRSTVGVSGLVRFGPRFAVVPDQVIDVLRARADPQTGLHRLARRAWLVPGCGVRIAVGPFEGLEGVFERAAGSERVVILLELLGQHTPVRVPAEWVVPHGDSPGRRQSWHSGW